MKMPFKFMQKWPDWLQILCIVFLGSLVLPLLVALAVLVSLVAFPW